jgi:16S rRNA processing protein RimM
MSQRPKQVLGRVADRKTDLNDRPITLAVIIGAHGVTGEVRLKLFTQDVDSFKAHQSFNAGSLTLKNLRHGNNGAIARFAQINDRNAAEAARGTQITIAREALPPLAKGEYYHVDLLGLRCVSTSGEDLGICIAIENFGAGDVIEVERHNNKRFMVPMTPEAVPEWGEQIVIDDRFAG